VTEAETHPAVSVHLPSVPIELIPSMRPEDDSIATFHPGKPINLANDTDTDEEKEDAQEDSTPTTRKTTSSPVGILYTPRIQEDAISKIFFSDY
jgi:hypothetical protein